MDAVQRKENIIPIKILRDEKAGVWFAVNDTIGLALQSTEYDTLVQRIQIAAPEMAMENGIEYEGWEKA